MAHFIYSAFCDESGESTIGGQIAACKKNGITHMELRGFGKSLNINNLSVEQAKEMKKEIDREGMKVASIGSGYGKINIKEDFAPHFEAFKNTVEVAKILEAKYIRVFSFYFSEGDGNVEEILRRFDKNKKAVILSLEPHLKVFEGLGKLEAVVNSVRKIKVNSYPSHAESFKAATDAMYGVVDKIHPIRFGIIGMGNMGISPRQDKEVCV